MVNRNGHPGLIPQPGRGQIGQDGLTSGLETLLGPLRCLALVFDDWAADLRMAPSRRTPAATSTEPTSSHTPPLLVLDSLGIGQEIRELAEKVVVVAEQTFDLTAVENGGRPLLAWKSMWLLLLMLGWDVHTSW